MLSMLPLRDREVLRRLNAEAGEDCSFAYCLYDGGAMEGYLLYDITEEKATIRCVKAADEAAFDGLVRAVFSSLYDLHIDFAVFSEKVNRTLLEGLSFVAAGECVTPSIQTVLFHCKHKGDERD